MVTSYNEFGTFIRGYQKLKLHSELKFKKGFRLYVISFYEAFNAITLAILLHWNEIIQD